MSRIVAQMVALISVLGTAALLIVKWPGLPERIPTHFNAAGIADGWGAKGMIFIVPAVSFGIYSLFSLLERMPTKLNYPVQPTAETRVSLYALNTDLMVVLKSVITAGFFYITLTTIRTAEGTANGLGVAFLPIFLLGVFLPIGYFVWKMSRLAS